MEKSYLPSSAHLFERRR
uniref:Uncharacterized protein n=1 Tax=Anguilla anguilla TaxID=7936 RepID=A0A0E9URZ1_ANGAN